MGACRPSCPSAAASKQHLHSTYPTPAFSYSRLRPQKSYFLLPALQIYFCLCSQFHDCWPSVYRNLVATPKYTRRASISFAAFPSHFVAQQPRNTAFLRRHPPISALIKQQPVSSWFPEAPHQQQPQIWTPLPRVRPTRSPGVVGRWPAQTSPRMELVWKCSSISSHRISIDLRIGVVTLDPWLSPFKDSLKRRYSKAQDWIKTIQDTEGGLDKFSKVWLVVGWDSLTSHGADSHIRGPTPWDCT